ncbi:site-2 protease family protein [Streptomyces sp. AN091965]|nr:site-2 protease family protein [Streptomyces sp. AN091965]MCI3929530.1 site-2 protease family protein [Streptomyces sp. AN091965]
MDESGGSGRPQSDSTPERDPAGAHPARPETDGPGPEPTPDPTAGAPERTTDGPAPERTSGGTEPSDPPTDDTPEEPSNQPVPQPSKRATPEPPRTEPEPAKPEPEPVTPKPEPVKPEPAKPEPEPSQPAAPKRATPAPEASEPAVPSEDAGAAVPEPEAIESPAPKPAASGSATPEPEAPATPAPEPEPSEPTASESTPSKPQTPEPGTGAPTSAPAATPESTPAQAPQPPTAPAPTPPRVDIAKPRPAASGGRAGGDPAKEQPKNPGGGLLMGRPFGVPVYVAPSWFLVAALITWVFGDQLDRVLPELGGARYLVSLFFAVAFYASVLVHELAHTVAALRFKLPVRRIQLQFFGGVSEIEKESETPGREFVLAFVGPLLSLVLAGVFYVAMRAVEPDTVPGVLIAGLMISNLIVAIFNLLPGLPLDGGRMLRAVVWKITGRPMSGTVAAAWVGRALAISVLVGLPVLNQSGALGGDAQDLGGMDTVTDALLAAILAAIIWTGAGNSLRMARLREHLPELRARALTRRAVPVETDTPLSEALRRANAAGARALVVVDTDGDPMAVVREAAIVGVPEHRRPWVTVSGLAQDITEGMRVPADLAGEELLDRLRATPATEYLVVETSGEIYGVLSAADVERAFVKAMARPT